MGKHAVLCPALLNEVPQVGWQPCHPALLLRAEERALGHLQPFSTQLHYVASVGFATQLCPKRQSFVRLDEEKCLSFLLFCQ